MNTGLDLDALRGRWGALDRPLDDSLEFDLAALRASLSQRMHSAFRRHSQWLVVALVFDALALAALLVFGIAHWNVPVFALSALALWLVVLMEAGTDLNQWRVLRTLDLDAPVLDVRERLAALRTRRLRTTGAVILFSIALWFPFLIVLVKGVFGGDLYAVLHWSVLVGNIAFGLLFIPLGAWIGRIVARRFRGSAGFEQFLDDAAGKSWSAANNRWTSYAQTEEMVARGDAAMLLRHHADRDALAKQFARPLGALKRSLWLGIGLGHRTDAAGGMVQLAAGRRTRAFSCRACCCTSTCSWHMVANIAHLHAVKRLDLGAPPQRLATTLAWMATAARAAGAAGTLVLAPLFLLPAAIVLGKALFDVDLFAAIPAGAQFAGPRRGCRRQHRPCTHETGCCRTAARGDLHRLPAAHR
jgi:hypothetical protein